MNPRLTHMTFSVKDFDESIQFYKEWFGLEVHRDRRPFTIWLATQEQNKKEKPDFVLVLEQSTSDSGKMNHFGFQIDDRKELDVIADKARRLEILVEGPTDIGGVVGSFIMIRDPNGHLWEITVGQPLKGL